MTPHHLAGRVVENKHCSTGHYTSALAPTPPDSPRLKSWIFVSSQEGLARGLCYIVRPWASEIQNQPKTTKKKIQEISTTIKPYHTPPFSVILLALYIHSYSPFSPSNISLYISLSIFKSNNVAQSPPGSAPRASLACAHKQKEKMMDQQINRNLLSGSMDLPTFFLLKTKLGAVETT